MYPVSCDLSALVIDCHCFQRNKKMTAIVIRGHVRNDLDGRHKLSDMKSGVTNPLITEMRLENVGTAKHYVVCTCKVAQQADDGNFPNYCLRILLLSP